MSQAKLLTAKDAAPLVGISAIRLYRLARENQLPPGVVVRLSTRAVRFSAAALEAWLGGSTAAAVAPVAPVAVSGPPSPVTRCVRCPECGTEVMWVPR
jgi:predicted DNA-binding transcriptional regulator AlpA